MRNIHFLSRVEKLGERGWSVNQRVLTLDASSVAYYSKVPKKEEKYGGIYSGKVAPKHSLPLAGIVEVRALSVAPVGGVSDKAQIKKFGKEDAVSQMFKIIFHASTLVEGEVSGKKT